MTDPKRFTASTWKRPVIEHLVPTKWQWLVSYPDGLELSPGTDIGAFTYIQAQAKVIIEENVEIGSHCSIYSVSTINDKQGPVILKKGCKIGSHSLIMPNVTIGENAIIGAHSYIDTDVSPGTIVVPKKAYAYIIPKR